MTDLRKMSNEELLDEYVGNVASGIQVDSDSLEDEINALRAELLRRLAPSEEMKPLSPSRSGEPPTVEGFVKSFLSRVAGLSEEQSSNIEETLSYMLRSYFSAAAPSSGEPPHQICQACCTEVCIHSRCPNCHRCDRCQERAARPSEPSAPQASAEQYIGSDQERVFLEKKALGDFAASQPVSGDAPKVEEIARQLNHKFGFHSSRVLTYEGALEFLRPYFPPASQTPPISEHVLNEIVLAICEIPDRTSPDDFPEAMIVTPEELRFIIRDKFEQAATPASTARTDGWIDPENYVAWCRRSKNTIVTCDSDAPGAFKVYRLAAPGSVPQAPVAANTRCSEHKVFHPACADCWKEYYKSPAFGVPPAEPPKEEKP